MIIYYANLNMIELLDISDLETAQRMQRRTVIWGQNFEPFQHENINERLLPVLRESSLIYVRDYDSKAYLADKRIVNNVVFAPDPAFLLPACDTDRIRTYLDWASAGPTLGVSISAFHLRGQSLSGRIQFIAKSLRTWIDGSGYRVLLIPHVVLDGRIPTNDYVFSQRVLRAIDRNAHAQLMPGHFLAGEYKAVIGKCALFMGSRMHATIAALSQSIPTLSLSYSKKSLALQAMLLDNTEYSFDIFQHNTEALHKKLQKLHSEKCIIAAALAERLKTLFANYETLASRVRNILLDTDGSVRD